MKKDILLDIAQVTPFVGLDEINALADKAGEALATLHAGNGAGNDFLGWLNLPNEITASAIAELNETATVLRENCDVVVVVGIGGSYLGAKAVIEALNNSFDWLDNDRRNPVVVYAGQNIGEDYLYELQQMLHGRRFGIISISKSGTTTEPALAFRLLKTQLEEELGKEFAKKAIVCITDRNKGALRKLADQEGYKTFVIEDNVGGRFSVLTPVGLLPIAVAGYDIEQLVAGARRMYELCAEDVAFENNIAMRYAAVRYALYQSGKKIELLANFAPKLHYVAEWWKQLYGESEGKDGKGIFPASVDFTTDLHSMGQYIQDGERHLFETVLSVAEVEHEVRVPRNDENLDGLNFLAGRRVDEVNRMAELGTMLAHVDGGVPNIRIILPRVDEYALGEMIYFFEKACGISGYMLGVNPFDQPGVEAYKKNMFALLEKPGYEAETEAIKLRINN